jgi:hypothetical protein
MNGGVQDIRETCRRCHAGHRRARVLDAGDYRTHADEIARGRQRSLPYVGNHEYWRIGIPEHAFRGRSKQRVGGTRHAVHAEDDHIRLLPLGNIADGVRRFTGDDVLMHRHRMPRRRRVCRETREFLVGFAGQVDALGFRSSYQQAVLGVQNVQRGLALFRQPCREVQRDSRRFREIHSSQNRARGHHAYSSIRSRASSLRIKKPIHVRAARGCENQVWGIFRQNGEYSVVR